MTTNPGPIRSSTKTLQLLTPLFDCPTERSGWVRFVELACGILGVDHAAAIEFVERDLAVIRCGFGSGDSQAGTIVPVAPDSQAAMVRSCDSVVVSADLLEERRFVPSRFLVGGGFRSSMSMSIEMSSGHRAVIGAYSRDVDRFLPDDVIAFESLGAVFAGVIRRLRRSDELEVAARIDPLTGLSNRSEILHHLDELLTADESPTVMLLDIDGFKAVNDTLGHRAGDVALRTIAARLERSVDTTGRLGRLGGDEFLLVCDPADPHLLAERLVGHVEEIIMIDSGVAQVSASVGIARRRTGDDSIALIERADRMMYQAKSAGRGRVRSDLSVDDTPRAAPRPAGVGVRAITLECVEQAIAGLRIVVQPIIDADTRLLHGLEALARGPDGHDLELPDQLFAAARTFSRLGELELAAKRLAFGLDLDVDTMLYVNLEPSLLLDGAWMAELTRSWRESGGCGSVTVELTEREVLTSPGRLLRAVDVCRAHGWKIALDDVGSRSESLAALRWVDPDVVKLDMRLISNENTAHAAHVAAAIASHRDMERHGGVRVIAEGVETEQHVDTAEVLGADLLQGYLFGRPTPVGQMMLSHDRSRSAARMSRTRTDGNRVATKRELIAMTRHVEASVASADSILVAAVQNVETVSRLTRRQYESLARRCGFVGMIGVGMSASDDRQLRGVRVVDLDPTDPLTRCWQVVTMSPTAAIGLLATEIDTRSPDDDLDRLFSYRFITDPVDVDLAARRLLRYF